MSLALEVKSLALEAKSLALTSCLYFFTERVVNIWINLDKRFIIIIIEARTVNTFKGRLQKLYDTDESFFGQYLFSGLRRPSQSPEKASPGKHSPYTAL